MSMIWKRLYPLEPERIDFNVVKSMLRATQESAGMMC